MLSVTEQVWRHLVVSARRGRRRWSSLAELAGEMSIPVSTLHGALARPTEIGAVIVRPGGGLSVVDPERLVVCWAGRRSVVRDVVRAVHVAATSTEVESRLASRPVILGGFGAMVAALGSNTIADYDTVIVYGDPGVLVQSEQGPTEVLVLEPDQRLASYGPTTPLVQAWVDLFCLPGWQAARFVHQTLPEVLDGRVLSA